MNLKAILYDFDGTLVDSEKLSFQVWKETLLNCQIEINEKDYFENYAGIPTPMNSKRVVEKYNLSITSTELTRKIQEILGIKLHDYKVDYMPYVLESIHFFKSIGLKLGIVTGSPRESIDKIFTDKEIRSKFNFIITRDDVKNSKPDKESYALAIQNLGVTPKEIIVFEDTANGVISAKSAGIRCYAVQQNKLMYPNLKKADKIFTDLQEATNYIKKYVLKNHS